MRRARGQDGPPVLLADAKQHLDALGTERLGGRAPERNLLYARTLEQLGEVDAALVAYEAVLPRSSGEEARCRYAGLLEKAGQPDKAKDVYRDILRRAQSHWINVARQCLDRVG